MASEVESGIAIKWLRIRSLSMDYADTLRIINELAGNKEWRLPAILERLVA